MPSGYGSKGMGNLTWLQALQDCVAVTGGPSDWQRSATIVKHRRTNAFCQFMTLACLLAAPQALTFALHPSEATRKTSFGKVRRP